MLLAVVLLIYIRNGSKDYEMDLNRALLASLSLLYVFMPWVYPTYILWAVPFLFLASLVARDVERGFIALYLMLPTMYQLFWNPLYFFVSRSLTDVYWPLGWPSVENLTTPLRDLTGLDFSLVCAYLSARIIALLSGRKILRKVRG
jgi:hypothetical protein